MPNAEGQYWLVHYLIRDMPRNRVVSDAFVGVMAKTERAAADRVRQLAVDSDPNYDDRFERAVDIVSVEVTGVPVICDWYKNHGKTAHAIPHGARPLQAGAGANLVSEEPL